MKISFLIFLISINANANYPEMFGASFSTAAIGNQANYDDDDSSNNYYAPALLGFSEKFNLLLQTSLTEVSPKKIENIIVTNGTNSSSSSTFGNANTHYKKFYGGTLHAALPVGGNEHFGTLGLSLFLPLGDLVQTNSGHPFLPEYIMYRSRHTGTSVFLNFAKKLNDNFSFSLGTTLGFQATADVKTNLSLNGNATGSWAQGQAKVSPSLGLIASIAKKIDNSTLSFTYQQEMKSNLKTTISGEIINPSVTLLDSRLDSMIFYEPHTFRLGGAIKNKNFEYFLTLEYLIWSNYKAPIMTVAKTGGVIVPSSNFEKINIRDTVNPRIGFKINLTDRWSTLLGAQYRMTPLKGNFSGSGNSVDVDTLVGTMGLQYRMVIWSKDVHLGTSFQYHRLKNKRVNKTSGEEDGSAGQKIGAPGYNLGGHILASTLGVKFNF